LPVRRVVHGHARVIGDDQNVLGVFRLSGGGEVEAAGDDRAAVDHHDLVMRDAHPVIDQRLDAVIAQVRRAGVATLLVGLVEDDAHVDAARLGAGNRGNDRRAGEAVSLHKKLALGALDLSNYERGAILARREARRQVSGIRASGGEEEGKGGVLQHGVLRKVGIPGKFGSRR